MHGRSDFPAAMLVGRSIHNGPRGRPAADAARVNCGRKRVKGKRQPSLFGGCGNGKPGVHPCGYRLEPGRTEDRGNRYLSAKPGRSWVQHHHVRPELRTAGGGEECLRRGRLHRRGRDRAEPGVLQDVRRNRRARRRPKLVCHALRNVGWEKFWRDEPLHALATRDAGPRPRPPVRGRPGCSETGSRA